MFYFYTNIIIRLIFYETIFIYELKIFVILQYSQKSVSSFSIHFHTKIWVYPVNQLSTGKI